MNGFTVTITALALAFLGGCNLTPQHAKSMTVGNVGCPESEIEIVGEPKYDENVGRTTWEARCRGATYYCGLSRAQSTASCTEAR